MPFDDGKKTVSGSIAHTDDAAAKVPFVSVKCGIKPTLDGVTSIDVVRPDGNVLQTVAESKTQNGVTWTVNADGSITLSGTSTARTYLYVHLYHKILPKDATLTVSVEGLYDNGATDVFLNLPYSNNGTTYSGTYGQVTWGSPKKTISYTADKYIGFLLDCPANVTTNQTVKIMVTIGSEAKAFEPYVAPVTDNVELGQTVYGGTADIVNGTGTEKNSAPLTFDGSEDWRADTTRNGVYLLFPTMGIQNFGDGICNMFTTIKTGSGLNSLGICFGVNNYAIYIPHLFDGSIPEVTDVATWETYLSSHDCTISYPLATPTDFTFSPITPTPETVGKVNNVYCNTGDTELTYYDNSHGFAEVTVNRTGKNLLPTQTIVTQGNTHYVGGADSYFFFKKGTYTESNLGTGAYMYWRKKGTTDNNIIHNYNSNSGTFTLDEDCEIRFWYYYVGTPDLTNIQIEVGTEKTNYEPFEAINKTAYLHKVIYGGEADVIEGTCEPKNLLELYLARTSHLGINFSLTELGLLHMEGTNTSSTGSAFSGGNYNDYDSCPWKFPAGTYTASSLITDDNDKVGSVNLLIRTKTDNTQYSYYLKDASKTFTVNDDFGAWFWASVLKTETVNCDVGVQLEKGGTVTDFAPYFDPFTFPPVEMETVEGLNVLYANEGDSAIIYRKAVD